MADKRLIRVPLTELRTNDEEVIGSLYPHKGKIYRWVKNAGGTALTAGAVCLEMITSVVTEMEKRIIAPSGSGASTASILRPGGVPMASFGGTGTDTGDHGWVLVKGITEARVQQAVTAVQVGEMAIASDSGSDVAWASPVSAATGGLFTKKVVVMEPMAVTGAATSITAIVDVQCL